MGFLDVCESCCLVVIVYHFSPPKRCWGDISPQWGNPEAAETERINVKKITYIVFWIHGHAEARYPVTCSHPVTICHTHCRYMFEMDAIAARCRGVSAAGGVRKSDGSLIALCDDVH